MDKCEASDSANLILGPFQEFPSRQPRLKGAQFENVLVVFGRGWNDYNFVQFLERAEKPVPDDKLEAYERNRNLFYVACSRPKKRLALLFTQELTPGALTTLATWFGEAPIRPLPNL